MKIFLRWAVAISLATQVLCLRLRADEGACDDDTRPRKITEVDTIVTTPGHPGEYPPNSHCGWLYEPEVDPEDDEVVMISFSEFDLTYCTDCGCDYVEVFDGPDENSPRIARYCGTVDPPAITGTGGSMYIKFVSNDDARENTGLEILLSVVPWEDPACTAAGRPRIIHDHEGTISSLNFPGNYPPNTRCEWLFDAPDSWTIEFEVTTLETPSACCECDLLQIYDGTGVSATRYGAWYGDDLVPVIRSRSDKLYVLFSSNNVGSSGGFHANFRMFQDA